MPVFDQEKVEKLKQILKWHPRGITISDLSARLEMNRNLVAKYLDILLISGQVEMQVIGASKVYFLSRRVPVTSMLEFSSDMLIIIDGSQKIIQVNEPLLAQVHETKDMLTGRKIREINHPFLNAIPDVIHSTGTDPAMNQVQEFECTLEGKDCFFRLKQLPTAFEDGDQGITLIIEDITPQITSRKMLELNEAKYRGIVEDQTEFITRFLPDGTLIFINDAYARYLGKDKEVLLGGNHIPYIESKDIAPVHQSIRSLDIDNPVVTFECRIHHSGGQCRWNLWTVRALFDEKNKPVEYQGVGRDNTEKREAATRINQYVRDLEFLSRKAQEFVEISPDADIFQAIAQGLLEIIPEASIAVNSIDVTSKTLTVRAVSPNHDQQILKQYLGRDLKEFEFNIGSLPEEKKKGFFSAILAGKLVRVQESLFDIFFRQIPRETCDKITADFGLGDWFYTIGLARHGIIFGSVSFSLKQNNRAINESIIETFIRQASIVLHRRHTEAALKASETKYRGIVEDQTEFVARFLPDGRLTYVNDSLCRFFFMDREELLGKSFFSLSKIPRDDQDTFRHGLLSLNTVNPVLSIEYRIMTPHNDIRWTQWTIRAFFGESGSITEYQGVGRDITEQKSAEAEIRQYIANTEFLSQKSFEFLELPTDTDIYETICRGVKAIVPAALVAINSDDPVTNVATTRCVLGDEDRDVFSTFIGKEVIGMEVKLPEPDELQKEKMAVMSRKLVKIPGNLFITMHKQVPEEICVKIEEALNIGDIYAIGLVYDGILRASVVIMLRKGEIITNNCLIETYMAHASIALQRYQMEKTLKKSEKLYRSVIENIQDVFYRSDKEGTLIMASPSWAQLLGYDSLDDCIGYSIAEKFYFEPHRRKEFLEAVNRNGSVSDYEVVLKRRDGSPVHVSTNSHLYYSEAGELLGVEGIFRDISERYAAAKKMHEQIEQMDFFSQKLQDFIELPADSDVYYAIGQGLSEFLPNSMIIVNTYNRDTGILTIRALVGDQARATARKYLQSDLTGFSLHVNEPVPENLIAGKIYPVRQNFNDILSRNFSQDVSTAIIRELNLGDFYYLSLFWKGSFLGNITFGLPKGEKLEKIPFIELYGKAASIALQRHLADDALKESEEIFSSVAHYSPVPLAIIEPDGTYRYINQKFTETFGYDLNDFRNGHEWFSLAYPDPSYRKKVIDAWKSDLMTYKYGIERPRRFTVRCKNGSDREIVFRPVTLANKKQFVVYEEITGEQKSDHLKNILSFIVANSPDGIISENNDGIILSWNRGARQMLGYTEEEALGHHISLIIPEDQEEASKRMHNRVKKGETIQIQKTHLKNKNGEVINAEVTLSPIIDENGIQIGQSTICRNISLNNAQQEKNTGGETDKAIDPETGDSLANVLSKPAKGIVHQFPLSSALKMARDYIAILDRTGKCMWANDALVGALNADSWSDLEGKNIALYIAPEFRKIALDSLMEIKKSGNKTIQLMMLSSSGRVPVEANLSAINTETGELFGYMAIARNIERNKMEKQKR
jgi:PAS domain S-box-containing protein